ncbi:hypothetical protein [Sphingorhabdus sp. Alg239-R122]|uniref:hypothetical protein n=1 Tax=Sphingorhabdus sp. Alg239-R122 TaxID=2305989 RepID=UPI0013DCBA19|nr:hypothetical protein [Sphingorhabdus sp. Alg239-R122]
MKNRIANCQYKKFFTLTVLLTALAACTPSSDITDPDEHEDYDDDGVIGPVDDNPPLTQDDPALVTCLLPELVNNPPAPSDKCFKKASDGSDSYTAASCQISARQDQAWVKAKSQSYYNSWVLVSESDPKLTIGISMPGNVRTVSYAPDIIYDGDRNTFSHKECDFTNLTRQQCPVPDADNNCLRAVEGDPSVIDQGGSAAQTIPE